MNDDHRTFACLVNTRMFPRSRIWWITTVCERKILHAMFVRFVFVLLVPLNGCNTMHESHTQTLWIPCTIKFASFSMTYSSPLSVSRELFLHIGHERNYIELRCMNPTLVLNDLTTMWKQIGSSQICLLRVGTIWDHNLVSPLSVFD